MYKYPLLYMIAKSSCSVVVHLVAASENPLLTKAMGGTKPSVVTISCDLACFCSSAVRSASGISCTRTAPKPVVLASVRSIHSWFLSGK